VTASRLLPFSLVAFPLVFAACGGEGLTLPDEGEPARIEILEEGNNQSGRVNEVLPVTLKVRVTDSRGEPVPGRDVLFSFAGGAAAGVPTPESATTDSDGQASTTLALGNVAGTHKGTAQVQSAPAVNAEFTVTALPADANGIRIVSGDPQTATVNSALPQPLVVLVTDANDNPIPNVAIQWTAEGGGTVSAESNVTDGNGQASVTRTLGPTAGTQTTRADAGPIAGSPALFTHTATAGGAAGITKVSGDNQSGAPGTELALPLIVEVRDEQGNPISGRAVAWVVGTGGGSVSAQTTPTNAEGRATTNWTLGPAVGPNSVNAVVSGVGTATFNATATAGLPSAGNSEVSAAPTTITVGGQSTITVVARDASNNPVSGASVSVASTGTGNTITPASASTGANGVATFTFSSTVAETKTITATAGGVALNDSPTITVQKTGSTVEITEDEPDPSTVGTAITVEFSVRGSGGTPTGEVIVTLSGGDETCRATLVDGNGSCGLTPTVAGPDANNNRRIITATYGGDARFSGDTDTENHRVNPAPQSNQAPTAAFTPPSCTVGLPCTFTDGSTDSDGFISDRFWTFQDAVPSTSGEQSPTVIFSTEGSRTVTLEVTDNQGATDTETQQVTVTLPTPVNQAPIAGNDAYTTPGAGQGLTVPAPGVLSNDTDPDGPQPLVAQNAGTPSQGSVSLNPDGSFTYTPTLGATGTDSFTYEAFDGADATQATVTITIAP
jgi:VCBS repeat-containing protein